MFFCIAKGRYIVVLESRGFVNVHTNRSGHMKNC